MNLFAGRLAILIGAALVMFGWREKPKAPRQPTSFDLRIERPTQVRPADKPPKAKPTVSVLVKAEPDFLENVLPPVRKLVQMQCDILTDHFCRIENPHYWKDHSEPGDFVTWVHELCHGLSNKLHASTAKHGIYLGDGKGIVLKHPNITIEQVAHAVPKEQRGPIFDLYLVKQRRDWNNSPAYLLDEWNAYIHGAIARAQLGWEKRQETEEFAREMERYCRIMLEVTKQRDPDYPDMAKLSLFIDWQSKRFDQIVAEGGKQ